MLNIGIVGYDHVHIMRYVPTLLKRPDVKIAKIAGINRNIQFAQKDARDIGCPYYADLDGFFDNLDAIYIGTDPTEHVKVINIAAENGVHVLCDKPIATNLEDADRIIAAARKNGIKLMVPFNPRFQLPIMKAKEMIDNNEIGDLKFINAVKYGKSPKNIIGFDTSWFFNPDIAGFGGFGDIGIHAVDALLWFSGSSVCDLYANIGRRIDMSINIDDYGSMVMTFENGMVATLSSGWANPTGYPKGLDVRFEILGTKGALLIEKPHLDFDVSDGTNYRNLEWRVDIDGAVNEFISCVSEDRDPMITGEDAKSALEVILAAYSSAKNRKLVTLSI